MARKRHFCFRESHPRCTSHTFLPLFTVFFSWFRHSRWLLSFILASFFAASCSKAGGVPADGGLRKLQITLQRSACFGTCPNYKVTIHRDGRVVFTTDTAPAVPAFVIAASVLLPGTHEDRIARGEVAVCSSGSGQQVFSISAVHTGSLASNLPTYVLTVDAGQQHKSVEDYWGQRAGMPVCVTELEKAVDKVAGTDRWVRGSAGLTTWLERQNFDFHSLEAARLAVFGAHRTADEALVLALINRGIPLDGEVSNPKSPVLTPTSIVVGFSLIESAIKRGQVRLFNNPGRRRLACPSGQGKICPAVCGVWGRMFAGIG